MNTSDFDYALPPDRIAQTPIEPRDSSRLLVVHRDTGRLEHRVFRDIVDYLRPGDLLVANDSRVIPARLHGRKTTGGQVEILLLRRAPDPEGFLARFASTLNLASKPSGSEAWECLVGGKGLRPGVQVVIDTRRARSETGPSMDIVATIEADLEEGGRLVSFSRPVHQWLYDVGEVPLPPYIHQALDDSERYQTVYSRVEGSAASSTAGLHFTPELLLDLRQRGVGLAFVTLHIGLDTFQPVKAERVEDHPMHSEWASLATNVARQINETALRGGRVVAVGTTAVRTLEWAATGAQGLDPYDVEACPWKRTAAFEGPTNLFIRPGYRFRAVDALITNFHLPRSTLLMLVSAFAGKALIDEAYRVAVEEGYRFYSFGDAMVIL
ncbi:MAG TPA: tRNA preQ1(34) S-adenosylmethionine ribosyltransferase-isomerase QueA [Anaerolineae bacterium]|nr:tRNA preQ1(34) S-adenosylmethionine ribosyltransferase-isomerase QueA [Anaerolineae bacterium]